MQYVTPIQNHLLLRIRDLVAIQERNDIRQEEIIEFQRGISCQCINNAVHFEGL